MRKKDVLEVIVMGVIAVTMLAAFTGCAGLNTTTVKEIDPATGKVTKETTTKTEQSLAQTIVSSTEHKSIYVFSSGWFFWFEVTPGTPDNPTPHAKAKGGCIDEGMLLLHKDQQNIQGVADVIRAGRSNFSASATGASSNASAPANPSPAVAAPSISSTATTGTAAK
ncbi:MAG: hypothetical protein WCI51_00855 [Lentisphaerota bacterium]